MIDSDDLTPLGRLLRGARLTRDLNLAQASMGMGMRTTTLGRYERGENVPEVANMRKLASFYGIPMKEIFDKIEETK